MDNNYLNDLRLKYKFHEETDKFLEQYEQLSDSVMRNGLNVEDARRLDYEMTKQMTEEIEFEGKVWDLKVPTSSDTGGVPVTIYKTLPQKLNAKPTILVYYHGGGLIVGSRYSVDYICKTISRDAECIVVNVEYRLVPEHKLPGPYDDAVSVMRYILMNKSLFGAVNSSRVGVAGDSAGGLLASAVCNCLKGISYQVLIYPLVDISFSQPSCEEFRKGPVISSADLDWMMEQCLPEKGDDTAMRKLSAMERDDNSQVPPTLIVVAELDPLRDSIQAYRKKLRIAGVKVESFMVKGVTHTFFRAPGVFKKCFKSTVDKICLFIKRHAESQTLKLLT